MAKRNQTQFERRKLKLFLGPFHPGLENAFMAQVAEEKEPDPFAPIVVLVGSNLLGLYLRRLLVQRGLNHINIRFLTLIDLAKSLAVEPLSKESFCPLPPFGDLLCLATVAEKIDPDGYFRPMAGRRGFQKALGATFQDLGDGGVQDVPLKKEPKIAELNALYQSYRQKIGKNFYNRSELLFRAGKEVSRFSDIFGCEELWVYGFYDFTFGQKSLLKACASELKVTAFMPWQDSPAYGYAAPTLKWFKDLGFEVKILPESAEKEESSIERVKGRIFRDRWKDGESLFRSNDRTVQIIAAPGETQEVKEIAREILRLAREEEFPFHEMAILLRNVETYVPLIQECFHRLRIPYYLPGGRPLSQTQAGKSLSLLLDLLGSNFRRAEVMEFLTFAPLEWTNFFSEEPSPPQWDLISREAGIVEGSNDWDQKLEAWIAKKKEEEEEGGGLDSLIRQAEGFRTFLKDFFLDLDRFPQKSTWQGMVDAAMSFLGTYFRKSEDQQAIFEILRELISLDALAQEVHLRRFREILCEALEETTLKQGSFQKEGVCVSDLMPARGLSFRAVFIPGLVERAFPAPPRQDPLLLDHERQEINQSLGGKGHIPLKQNRFFEEKLLFALSLGNAREKLILSYPRLDSSSGRERIPSFFLLRAAEALCGEAMDYSRLEMIPQYRRVPVSRFAPDDPGEAIEEAEFDLSQVGKALRSRNREEVAYLGKLFPTFRRAQELARLRWGLRIFTEYDGCLQSARARRLLRDRFTLSGRVLSPTQLETYASCPFKYFLLEVLALKALPSPEEILRIQPLERGTIVHEILRQFYMEVKKRKPGPLHNKNIEEYWEVLKEIAARVFSSAEDRGLTGYPLLWEIDRQAILEDLRTFLEEETKEGERMIPTYFEIRFGFKVSRTLKESSADTILFTLKDGTNFSLRGIMDRVDFSPEGDRLRVIDYKTGKLQGKEDGFNGGTTLQLPLYLMTSCQIWKQADLERSRAEYYSVSRKGKFKRLAFRGEGWKEKEKNLKKILDTIARGIREGIFFPYREADRDCGYCDFRKLCEHGVDVLFQKKKNDPQAAPFLEMREIP